MGNLLKRWWRWFTNPRPLEGQFWYLDGVGIVRVVIVQLAAMGVVEVGSGQTHAMWISDFRSQGTLCVPSELKDVPASFGGSGAD